MVCWCVISVVHVDAHVGVVQFLNLFGGQIPAGDGERSVVVFALFLGCPEDAVAAVVLEPQEGVRPGGNYFFGDFEDGVGVGVVFHFEIKLPSVGRMSKTIFIYLPSHVKQIPENPVFISVCGGILFLIYFWIFFFLRQTVMNFHGFERSPRQSGRVNIQLFTRKLLIVYRNSQAAENKRITKAPRKH